MDSGPAAWIAGRLHPFCQDAGSVVPEGYEAYVRLFHPVQRGDGGAERWEHVARRNGRVVHPEMQFHLISRPGADGEPAWGSLPIAPRQSLVEHLRAHTSTPGACWFATWEGYGGVTDPADATPFELPERRYLVTSGPIERALDDAHQSPNLWWPEDRGWIVATEVDYAWTYIGGTARLAAELLADPRLEALPATVADKPFADSDVLNATLDG